MDFAGMVSAEGVPSTNEINDLQRLPDHKVTTDAKGLFPSLATPYVHRFIDARGKPFPE